ncbi:Dyp-type peroxidase [Streptomyces sp. NBC_01565]|uniref:Dyp-type peroxidase n=1 Tax=unclassified Streptomyces TaxID=2593676 RepID=UPI002254498D|nr:Dyp-type peroxidase [Streptomyces sp. NBC_01565]MCX4545205.1 Dyp-type peroxidase [Streptomyces sp. NBC_01565]
MGPQEPGRPEEPGRPQENGGRSRLGRRVVLGAGGLAALAAGGAVLTTADARVPRDGRDGGGAAAVPFHGPHQAGILTRRQSHAHLAALDLAAPAAGAPDPEPAAGRAKAAALLRTWSAAAARMTRGEPPAEGAADTGVALGAGPAALTVTFGLGPGFFDRTGLAAARPEALAPLPAFPDDALDPARCGGDLYLQVAADDPLVAVHALRTLQRLARGAASTRWVMSGFARAADGAAEGTHRNLMGQLDGTANPAVATDPAQRARILVTGSGSGSGSGSGVPGWLEGGSYVVVRRIRMLLDHWDGLPEQRREQSVGRRVTDGAPLTGGTERTPVDLDAARPDGVPVIATNAHIRLAAPQGNAGATMLRRGWSYYDGLRPDGTPDAGLLFVAWQADPRTGFIPVQHRLARGDALARYVEHEASALFVVPRGAAEGALLEG